MKEIQIFSAKWDRYFNDIISDIKEVLKDSDPENKITVKVFDIDDDKNSEIFEKHIIALERRVGVTENPVRAVPLVVIDDESFSLGIGPKFKEKLAQRM